MDRCIAIIEILKLGEMGKWLRPRGKERFEKVGRGD